MKIQFLKASDNLNAPGLRIGRLYIDLYNRDAWLRGVFVSWMDHTITDEPWLAFRFWFYWTGIRGEVVYRGESYNPQIRFTAYLPTWIRVHILDHWQTLRHDLSYDAYWRTEFAGFDERPQPLTWHHRWQRTAATLELVKRLATRFVCKVRGHDYEHEEFVSCERDELGRITDIDGGGVYYWCKRCGHGGRSWF